MDNTTATSEVCLLVVDDNNIDRQAIQRYLGDSYDLLEATNGSQAEDLLRSHSLDCVLLDYHIPDTDTMAFLERCVEAQLPVVMLTGVGNEAVAVDALKRGAQDYLTKDQLTPDTLERTVAHAIHHTTVQRLLSEKQRELEDFVATAAHDIKSPLRTMVTQCQLVALLTEHPLGHEAQEALDTAVTSGKQLIELLEALLAYTRVGRESMPSQLVDLNEVIEAVMAGLETSILEAQAVVDVEPLPTICGDPTAMYQLLQNLVNNALKFRSENPPHIRIASSRCGSQWLITVTDNGIGIDPQFQSKIFEPLTRLHAHGEYEGSGLGLALCAKIAHQHKGLIWVESHVGAGSTFTVSLPVAPSVPEVNDSR